MIKKYKSIKFPKDEFIHNYIIEWWYFNGHLKDKNGNKYAFMNCLFKVNVKKAKIPFLSHIPFKISYFSHSLILDLKHKTFHHRIAPFSIISDDSFSKPMFYINYINLEIKKGYNNCIIEKTDKSTYHIKNEDIDLDLYSIKPPLLEGGKGYLDLHSKTTYYYSLTNLKTKGRIKIKNKWINITGKSWMDHQWADVTYSKDKWNWFSIQLDDDTEIVCCVYDDGEIKTYFADISYSNGKQEHFTKIKIIPLKGYWTSPKSKAVYPLSWQIKIPEKKLELNITTKINNQEILFGSINYWEGPIQVKSEFNGKKVNGVGFMELVGYPSQYGTTKYINDQIGKTIKQLVSITKNKFFNLISDFKKGINRKQKKNSKANNKNK